MTYLVNANIDLDNLDLEGANLFDLKWIRHEIMHHLSNTNVRGHDYLLCIMTLENLDIRIKREDHLQKDEIPL